MLMENRGIRREINYKKAFKRIKRLWNTYSSYHREYRNGKWKYASSINDALKQFKESNGKDFSWIIQAKEHHSESPRRSDMWDYYYYKLKAHKEKVAAKKQLKNDVDDAKVWFEYRCCNCDRFPGDLAEKDSNENGMICPYKHLFENGTYNGDTIWKDFNCQYFYD